MADTPDRPTAVPAPAPIVVHAPATAASSPSPPRPAPAPRVQVPRDVYQYPGSSETLHPVLGLIKPGVNRWPDPDEATVEALKACVASGLLRQG